MPYQSTAKRRSLRHQYGLMLTWTAVSITAITAISALTIDMGIMFWRKAEAKKAADAAALAGAWQFTVAGGTLSQATTYATYYAGYNGYSLDSSSPPHLLDTDDTRFRVAVKRTEPKCFLGVFNPNAWYSAATSTAQFKVPVDAPIQPLNYGHGNTNYSYSLFGPDAVHSNGDDYSTTHLSNGTVNPDYNPNGYPFTLNIPSDYVARNTRVLPGQSQTNPNPSYVQVEIFDPTTNSSSSYDEIRDPYFTKPGGYNVDTTTKYSLQYKSKTDVNDTWHTITSTSFTDESTPVGKWVSPSGFTIDISDPTYSGAQFQVVVQSTAGSSENGFSLRAGPPNPTTGTTYTNNAGTHYTISSIADNKPSSGTDNSWNGQWSGYDSSGNAIAGGINGTTIAAHGLIPLNINTSGNIDILLGNVPAEAAGGSFHVKRFDTDVGASALYYYNDWQGSGTHYNVASNVVVQSDSSYTDIVNLASNYPGANWHAVYTASNSDTSSWSIGWQQVNLVGGAGLTY